MPAQASIDRKLKDARDEVYRDHILAAAEAVFAAEDYDHATMREIAAAAGVSVGSLYGIFAGKEEIYSAIYTRHNARMAQQVVHALPPNLCPLDIITIGTRKAVLYFCNHIDYLKMQFREGSEWATEPIDSIERSNAWSFGYTVMRDAIAQGMRDGDFINDDPERIARVLISLLQVYLGDWLRSGQKQCPDALADDLEAMLGKVLAR